MLDLRFADDILVLATSSQQPAYTLDERVVALAHTGLILNENKTNLLTTQIQPPNKNTTPRGLAWLTELVAINGSDAFCLGTTGAVTDLILNNIYRLH